MIGRATLVLIFCICSTQHSQAAKLMRGCFEKFYSKDELNKNKGQAVSVMQLQLGFAFDANAGEGENDSLVVRFVGHPEEYYLEPLCNGNKDEASCDVQGSASKFDVFRTPKGVKIRLKGTIRLEAGAGNDSKKDIPFNPANISYELRKVSSGTCYGLEGRKK